MVLDVPADAKHGVRGIKLARLDHEGKARHLRDVCSREMDGEPCSACDAEPIGVRLTEAANVEQNMHIHLHTGQESEQTGSIPSPRAI